MAEEEQPTELHLLPMARKMRVLVAIDDSDNSFYALQWVIDHFSALMGPEPVPVVVTEEPTGKEGGVLTVVHVYQPFQQFAFPAGPGGAAAVYASSSMLETVRKAQQEESAGLLARALQMCRGKTMKVETLVLEGDPKDMICQAVEQMHVDLLVVGSRGLGRIKRAFLGSVSDYCAHHAKCPVLIVKPPKEMTSSEAPRA